MTWCIHLQHRDSTNASVRVSNAQHVQQARRAERTLSFDCRMRHSGACAANARVSSPAASHDQLDLQHQFEVMSVVRDYVAKGRIAVVVLHDLTFAARWPTTSS
jgi:hypothetical protein